MSAQAFLRRRGAVLVFVLLAPAFSGAQTSQTTRSEVGGQWPSISSYASMDCAALTTHLVALRNDLQRLQEPQNLSHPKWSEARNRFGLLVSVYRARECAAVSEDQMTIPPPRPMSGTSEELRMAGITAFRSMRFDAAEIWLRQASEAGDAEAQFNLSMLYRIRNRRDESRKWLERSAAQGWKPAQDSLKDLERQP